MRYVFENQRTRDSFLKLRASLCLFFLIFSLILPQLAFAGVDTTDVAENINPGTGSLMAAALETAGYAAQSQVLDHLGGMFESLGALIYVMMIIGAIFSVTIYGSYDGAAYLIFAPVLFFFLLNTRTVGYGAEWQWGLKDPTTNQEFTNTTTDEIAQAVGAIRNDEGDVVNRVSWLFHRYNLLTVSYTHLTLPTICSV